LIVANFLPQIVVAALSALLGYCHQLIVPFRFLLCCSHCAVVKNDAASIAAIHNLFIANFYYIL